MGFLFWLACLPFWTDLHQLKSSQWMVREQALKRIEDRLPWSYWCLLSKSQDPHEEALKKRTQQQIFTHSHLWKLGLGRFEEWFEERVGNDRFDIIVDGVEYRVYTAHWFSVGNHKLVIVQRSHYPFGPHRLVFDPLTLFRKE